MPDHHLSAKFVDLRDRCTPEFGQNLFAQQVERNDSCPAESIETAATRELALRGKRLLFWHEQVDRFTQRIATDQVDDGAEAAQRFAAARTTDDDLDAHGDFPDKDEWPTQTEG